MRTYPKRQPVWRNERFPRMQGFLDAIFRKVELRPDKDGPHCRGGWFERQRRRLQED